MTERPEERPTSGPGAAKKRELTLEEMKKVLNDHYRSLEKDAAVKKAAGTTASGATTMRHARGDGTWIPQVIASILLLWALNPGNPYAYYIFLRWVCCGIFAYLAIRAVERENLGWVWILGITAIVYNPIFRVHLNREIWSVVNLVTVAIAIASIFAAPPKRG